MQTHAASSLYSSSGGRKYLNAAERRQFAKAARSSVNEVRLFCLILSFSGARISEILALTPDAIDLASCVATIHTLKRRKPGAVRQVPLPRDLIDELNRAFRLRPRQRDPTRRLWRWSRTTAWRRVEEVMAKAQVCGTAAMPKGLRHGFGVSASTNLVPQHLIQRWLGHASARTTAISCDVCGPEERRFAARMWRGQKRRIWYWACPPCQPRLFSPLSH